MRILVIEPDVASAEAMAFALENAGFAADKVPTGLLGLASIAAQPPSAVVVAHPLADRPAFELCRAILEQHDLPVLLVTGCWQEETVLRGFAAGVDDVVAKPVRLSELVARVAAILRRCGGLCASGPESRIERGPFRLDPSRLEVVIADKPQPIKLTPLEAKLLGLLLTNTNQVMTKARLQELIWGYQNDSSGDLLKTHVRHLRVKLEDSPSAPRYIQTINGVGYTFVLPRPRPDWQDESDLTRGVPADPYDLAARVAATR
ncbi:MAG: response regulator transcription factor [Cyanobacteria bacterium REEB65]|nr:response regulator transcription factor [Cyanobacteria bacterium REEB65]